MNLGKSYLFLHKDEWNRLKCAGAPMQEANIASKNNEYVQSLIEKSQQWINSWPDSVQGHVIKLEKQKEKELAKNLAVIKLFKNEQKNISKRNKCIEKAKQIIFNDSCYGKRLISALLESKTLEERDAQIEFQKKIKESALSEYSHHNSFANALKNAADIENEEEQNRREKNEEVARVNKNIYLCQYENKKRDKERQKQMEIEDLRLMEKLNEKEAIQETNQKLQFEQDLEQFKTEKKKIQDRKMLREKVEDRLIEIWRKYEDKKDTMMKKLHEKRFEKSQSKENFALVKKLNDDEKKRYDDFVSKGITTHERRLQIKEEEDSKKELEQRRNQYLLAQSNKMLENAKRIDQIDNNILACHRQCLLPKCKNAPGIKQCYSKQELVSVEHFEPSNKRLVNNLKIREVEPSPWGNLSAAHAQFARHAEKTLQECRYKLAARKVVDDYRRSHGLTPKDLPIANYF